MSRLHTVRSLMRAGLISVVLGALLAGTAARAASAKLPGDFGPPRGEPAAASGRGGWEGAKRPGTAAPKANPPRGKL